LILVRLFAVPVYGKRGQQHLPYLLVAHGTAFLLFIPALLRIKTNQIDQQLGWYQRPTFSTIVAQGQELCGGRTLGILITLALVIVIFMVLRVGKEALGDCHAFQLLVLAIIWGPLTLVLTFVVSQRMPVFELRYLVPLAAGFPVAAAGIVALIPRPRVRLLGATVLVIAGLASFRTSATVREDWKAAATWVEGHRSAGDLVVVSAGYQCRTLVYALDRNLFQVQGNAHKKWYERERLVCIDILEARTLQELQPNSVILVQSHVPAVDPDGRTWTVLEEFGDVQRVHEVAGIRLSLFARGRSEYLTGSEGISDTRSP